MLTYFSQIFVYFDVFEVLTILFDYLLFFLNFEFLTYLLYFAFPFGSLFYPWQASFPIVVCMLFVYDLYLNNYSK